MGNGGGTESFTYDERDRLTQATATGGTAPYSEGDAYDTLGNLTNKGTTTYSYPGHTAMGRALPHAPAVDAGCQVVHPRSW